MSGGTFFVGGPHSFLGDLLRAISQRQMEPEEKVNEAMNVNVTSPSPLYPPSKQSTELIRAHGCIATRQGGCKTGLVKVVLGKHVAGESFMGQIEKPDEKHQLIFPPTQSVVL